ncbi:MAG: oligosaccharide flippase family protein, partial [Sinomicrobium sp.]|nr:oligosaccharide flippase family protein [Sinomicrobium sp.]
MSALQKLFKHTFVYGIATVLPRVLSVLLTRLYTDKLPTGEYGVVTVVFAAMIFFNVLLSYGMETAFFRFINKSDRNDAVQSTALTALFFSSLLFLAVTFPLKDQIAQWLDIKAEYIGYAILILTLDALVVIPFAWLRHREMPVKYTFIKVFNVAVNLLFNLFFFLWLPLLATGEESSLMNAVYPAENSISYIFIANAIASAITLALVLPLYFRIRLG